MRAIPTANIFVVEKSRERLTRKPENSICAIIRLKCEACNRIPSMLSNFRFVLNSCWHRTSRSALKRVTNFIQEEENQKTLHLPTELNKSAKIENLRKILCQRDQDSNISSSVNDRMTLPESQVTYSDPKWPLVSFNQFKKFSNEFRKFLVFHEKLSRVFPTF